MVRQEQAWGMRVAGLGEGECQHYAGKGQRGLRVEQRLGSDRLKEPAMSLLRASDLVYGACKSSTKTFKLCNPHPALKNKFMTNK